ncbi:threonine dehydratase [Phenylobacterium sp. Root77]|uniref:threonine ammonia-lyase n=1 Tax=unclassified Phenylobacterium TaxID=2640670 RepID=UPI0006FA8BF4|nr:MULTISPECIES: threonine ammonia-lyase [unclassified Phenylobacterium]KQW69310.1 threonine dehydratase [Phenylobacterium sp. Root1277]KQW95324.1 threonine dehydratase [Phenylobacterium sp. Root1290]KRC41115.1 threonine dehydratase [Phenylobacterium sp. Root77]
MTLSLDDIRAAADRLKGHIERTPCRHSRTLSEITGAEVWVKFENLQFTAAYKERGALNTLLQLSDNERGRGVIAASAGNHSQGLAYHAARLGIPVTIVMPRSTPFVKVQQTRGHGAQVVLDGDNYDEASAVAMRLRDEQDLAFVHPFNDLQVMAGQGTVALEMFEDVPDLEILPIPIGGGGLIAGCATVAKSLNPKVEVVGVEPAMYPSFTAKMRGVNGTSGGATIAEGIAVKQVGELSYAIARPLIDEVLLIEEPHFERAVALYCNVEKTVVEGAGAASLAALLAYPGKFKGKKVGLIVTGGNIDTRLLASVLTRELVRDQRLVSLRIIGDDRPGLLATVSAVIGQMGANIIEVAHNRLALDVPAKGAEFDIMIETRDAQHTQEIMDALREHGYPPRAV